MIEAFIPIFVAAGSGFAVLITRIHGKIHQADLRMDAIELRIATEYVAKADINYALDKMEADLRRIEQKVDRMIERN